MQRTTSVGCPVGSRPGSGFGGKSKRRSSVRAGHRARFAAVTAAARPLRSGGGRDGAAGCALSTRRRRARRRAGRQHDKRDRARCRGTQQNEHPVARAQHPGRARRRARSPAPSCAAASAAGAAAPRTSPAARAERLPLRKVARASPAFLVAASTPEGRASRCRHGPCPGCGAKPCEPAGSGSAARTRRPRGRATARRPSNQTEWYAVTNWVRARREWPGTAPGWRCDDGIATICSSMPLFPASAGRDGRPRAPRAPRTTPARARCPGVPAGLPAARRQPRDAAQYASTG